MQLQNITGKQLEKHRSALINFFKVHGDHRITKGAYEWIQNVKPEELQDKGTTILCAIDNKKLVGVLITANYGITESFIAVHKNQRNQHVARRMVELALSQQGKLYGRVAMDNIPSLKVCLENGLVAFHLFHGPTGKPSLWLGGGSWKREDVL